MSRIAAWRLEIIKRSDTTKGFEILPQRWVVERAFSRLGRRRRLAKDVEATIKNGPVWIFIAYIRTLTRRLVKP
jgi:putative transposase